MKRYILLILLVIMSICWLPDTAALSDYYKWTDKNGVTHYGQNPPEQHREDAVRYKEIQKVNPDRLQIPATMKMAPS